MMPSAEIPPATESPMIEPVPRPPPLELFEVFVWEGTALEGVIVAAMTLVTDCPKASVVATTTELTTGCTDEAAAEVA